MCNITLLAKHFVFVLFCIDFGKQKKIESRYERNPESIYEIKAKYGVVEVKTEEKRKIAN